MRRFSSSKASTNKQQDGDLLLNKFNGGYGFQEFIARVFVLPHMQKRHKGGEDAAVLTDRMLAVADGVGGWAESNIDPANYSRRLC